jgi:hypothetical protein
VTLIPIPKPKRRACQECNFISLHAP